jgi:hypothetical protein
MTIGGYVLIALIVNIHSNQTRLDGWITLIFSFILICIYKSFGVI